MSTGGYDVTSCLAAWSHVPPNEGSVSRGGWADPCGTRKVGGMHPTGMFSCQSLNSHSLNSHYVEPFAIICDLLQSIVMW